MDHFMNDFSIQLYEMVIHIFKVEYEYVDELFIRV